MENEKMEAMNKRIARKEELDQALAAGVLTLDDVLAMRPTDTSPEHHQTMVRKLSGRAMDSVVSLH